MSHASIKPRAAGVIHGRSCCFQQRGVNCDQLPERVLAVPRDFKNKRHMLLCLRHRDSFKKDMPGQYQQRRDLSLLEWRNYCHDTYGGMPNCACVGCQGLVS